MNITVLNAYLPRLDQAGIRQFVQHKVDDWLRQVADLQAKSFLLELTREDVHKRGVSIREQLDADLQQAALFELQVTNNNSNLTPSDIGNPVTGLLGWEPVFLSSDGSESVHDGNEAPSSLNDFRLAIWIHDWAESAFLFSPWGNLELPAFQPIPSRLWRLAPYYPLD